MSGIGVGRHTNNRSGITAISAAVFMGVAACRPVFQREREIKQAAGSAPAQACVPAKRNDYLSDPSNFRSMNRLIDVAPNARSKLKCAGAEKEEEIRRLATDGRHSNMREASKVAVDGDARRPAGRSDRPSAGGRMLLPDGRVQAGGAAGTRSIPNCS